MSETEATIQGEALDITPIPLSYLFVATFKDGFQLHQTLEDKSVIASGGSAYSDVLEYEKKSPLRCFILLQIGENGEFIHSYGVDLEDGHFEIDGVPFKMYEGWVKDLRLIFFRQHTHHFMMSEYTATREAAHSIVYRFGWQ